MTRVCCLVQLTQSMDVGASGASLSRRTLRRVSTAEEDPTILRTSRSVRSLTSRGFLDVELAPLLIALRPVLDATGVVDVYGALLKLLLRAR